MYAVIEIGGKQYKVSPGDIIKVDHLATGPGSKIELDRVLLVSSDNRVIVGQPHVNGAKVIAESLGTVRDGKIIVFHFKPKVRLRRKKGHRQLHTKLAIKEIHMASETEVR